jgi:hypothetical protein
VKEETLEAMLKHSRKKLNQRTGKLLAKHGNETMGNSTVLPQDVQPSDRDAVSFVSPIGRRKYSAPECCGEPMDIVTTKRNGGYRRYLCIYCERRESIGSKGRGRPRKS